MLTNTEQQHYHRQLILDEIGPEGQGLLKKGSVLVIGAGGLGCASLPYLAAAGIGHIGIVDFDRVDRSNLHRQVLFSVDDIGKNKAVTAAGKLSRLNPHIRITPHPSALTAANARELFSSYDIIVDGSDNFATRYLVNDAAVMCGKPVIFGSIFRFEAQLSVFNYRGGPTYRCIFPEPPAPGSSPNCSETGVMGVLPGIAGTLQANEAIKMICGTGQVLSGTLLTIDCLTLRMQQFRFTKNVYAVPRRLDHEYYSCMPHETATPLLRVADITGTDPEKTVFIDVRTSSERSRDRIGLHFPQFTDLHIPLDTLETQPDRIPEGKNLVFYCQSGIRSRQAADMVQKRFAGVLVKSLEGGINALLPLSFRDLTFKQPHK
ncbi:HesA/MoeB/ThiF family protein [Sinomicrobium soli]|uniref:HesA/MoeB/ThiF family protein n=1 Tax=Sinomicrobium sp. N-1-3-6 TaxID=2219864 RepID=UPI000DCD0225|nr:HesA/MoeB/ThiF family protein [Sinomicrobium sp. N-1-3-6]RAV27444.1 dinucleotide-utilizing protein [Sinomicrobium sp. N-1-3-6]